MASKEHNPKVPKIKVTRSEADEVYISTATEPLRKTKAKTPLHLSQPERDRNNRKAEEIVERANAKKKK